MRRAALTTLLTTLLARAHAHANIPAAYLACEGAPLGEPCVMTGPQYGVCLLDALCADPPSTAINECVLCVDACWGLRAEGEGCVRPWTGEEGVCEAQARCTDRAETSFLECVRCVAPSSPPSPLAGSPPEQLGCSSRRGGAPLLPGLLGGLCVIALLCAQGRVRRWLGVKIRAMELNN